MCALGYSTPIEYWCPECEWWTAGVIDAGKKTCPRCRRELWRCEKCHCLTFGTLDDPSLCKFGEWRFVAVRKMSLLDFRDA